MANFINAGCYLAGCDGRATHVMLGSPEHDPVTGLDLAYDQLLCGAHADEECASGHEVVELHQVVLSPRPLLKAVS